MANPMFGSRRAAAHRDRGARGLLSAIPVTEYVLFCLAEVRCRRSDRCQRALELPVRMGLASGEAELRDGDYFGTYSTVRRG
jgi:hypothetical protein